MAVASIPFILGMLMSITTTEGLYLSTAAMAAPPSAASATISTSSYASRHFLDFVGPSYDRPQAIPELMCHYGPIALYTRLTQRQAGTPIQWEK